MRLDQSTIEIQNRLADYCRTGIHDSLPGLTPGRIHHYRRLIYNVIKGTLEQAYPLTFDLLHEEEWERLVYHFFVDSDLPDPQLFRMPEHFYTWCVEHNKASELNRPYLDDLLLFEWVEIEVHTMPDIAYTFPPAYQGLLESDLVLNPEYQIIKLEYPVHKYPAQDAVRYKGQYFVLVFREPEYKRVEFVDLSILYIYLLQEIIQNQERLSNIIPMAVEKFQLNPGQEITNKILDFFSVLQKKGFVLNG